MSMPPRVEQKARGSQETTIIKSTTNNQNFVNGGATNKKGCDGNTSKVESTERVDEMEGSNTAGAYLQGEQYAKEPQEIEDLLQKPEAMINEQQQGINNQRLQLDDVCGKLEKVEREAGKQIQMLKEKLQAKDEMIDRLRTKVTEAASKTTEMSIGSSLLRLPESEIIKAWQTLHYEVRNFVMNYMKDASDRRIQNWSESQGFQLREITPSYNKFATDRKCGSWLIEAAIWSMLMRFVFNDSTTSGSICWAGKYAGKVSKLSGALSQTINTGDSEKLKTFHQWKAMTANLLSTLGPHNGRDGKTAEIVEELEELLEPLRSKMVSGSVRQGLQSLTRNAVALDESFCGQHEWYSLKYPKKRFDFYYNRDEAEVVEGNMASQLAAFVIRPCLCRAGGGRGKNYDKISVLDRYVVWTYASQRP